MKTITLKITQINFAIFIVLLTVSCNNKFSNKVTNSSSEESSAKIPKDIAETFGQLSVDTPPDSLYKVFNQFCSQYFGTRSDSLYYNTFGNELKIRKEGSWDYISEASATIAWETNLPAKTYVEYGKTQAYGRHTRVQDRHFFTHVHHLKNLSPATRYYYRLVAIDERGNKKVSGEKTFYTKKMPDAIKIPGKFGKPPYVLDKANTTYLVTEDIVAARSAFDIQAGGITLDLGGHTITHANELINDLNYKNIEKSGVGIRHVSGEKQSGLKIFNGILKQGKAHNNQDYVAGDNMLNPDPERAEKLAYNSKRGFSSIEITKQENVEIAGIISEYRLPQVWGMRFDSAYGKYNIHHNIFIDKGTQMFNRHGLGGARSLGFKGYSHGNLDQNGNKLRVHHNLIKRTRQNAINIAQEIYHNEIYVDSWVVNSFAVQPAKENGRVYGNKIFLTGYYGVGITWPTKELKVYDNFIHMESVRTMIDPPDKGRRLIETWGEQDVLAGMRLTNYGDGGQHRENLTYKNNVIFGRARDGAEMRGTEFFSDYSVKDLVFKDNIVKIEAMDSVTTKAACIDTQGAYNDRSTHLPVFYKNCRLISNICNIRFGDDYGQGSNHRFVNCKLVRTGNNSNYHTFVFDGQNSVFNHVLLDCDFGEGTNYKDVYWNDTGSLSNYRVQWTITVFADPGAEIIITDKFGKQVYNGTANARGIISKPLTQSIIRPVEWRKSGEEVVVEKKSLHQEKKFSPYGVTVKFKGKEKTKYIDVNQEDTLNFSM